MVFWVRLLQGEAGLRSIALADFLGVAHLLVEHLLEPMKYFVTRGASQVLVAGFLEWCVANCP